MTFRLIYEGPLRFVQHNQLRTNPAVLPSLAFERGGYLFTPVVTTRLNLIAHLDILFLRPGNPGSLITHGGDIDNRLKTLFDALQIPDANPIASAPPSADQARAPWGAAPAFCVLAWIIHEG